MGLFLFFALGLIGLIMLFKGIKIVPEQQAWVVERFGSYTAVLEPGLNILNPITQKVAYKHSLKEFAHEVQEQPAITRDNVTMMMDGVKNKNREADVQVKDLAELIVEAKGL